MTTTAERLYTFANFVTEHFKGKELDALVLQAYGFSPDDDLLEKLLALNLELAQKEKHGEPVVGPWDPTQE
ncbi:MAG: hypothetical protein AAGF66_17125 [Cyanobacteria bacterium P01_H01_bin.119]